MTGLEKYINSYFGIVDHTDLKTISQLFKSKKLNKGDYMLKSGNTCNTLCFIQTGLLRIYAHSNDKEITQWISSNGYFATDLSSFVFETPSRWNIQALVDTEVFVISKSDYVKIASLVPTWHELEKLFITKCFITLENRIFSHLSMTAEERYNYFFESHKELFNLVPQQYLASLLGMTPETFSRIRKAKLIS